MNPKPYNPFIRLIGAITDLVLEPIRRLLPDLGDRHFALYRHPHYMVYHVPDLKEHDMPTIACNLNSYGQHRHTAFEHLSRIGLTHVEIERPLTYLREKGII